MAGRFPSSRQQASLSPWPGALLQGHGHKTTKHCLWLRLPLAEASVLGVLSQSFSSAFSQRNTQNKWTNHAAQWGLYPGSETRQSPSWGPRKLAGRSPSFKEGGRQDGPPVSISIWACSLEISGLSLAPEPPGKRLLPCQVPGVNCDRGQEGTACRARHSSEPMCWGGGGGGPEASPGQLPESLARGPLWGPGATSSPLRLCRTWIEGCGSLTAQMGSVTCTCSRPRAGSQDQCPWRALCDPRVLRPRDRWPPARSLSGGHKAALLLGSADSSP